MPDSLHPVLEACRPLHVRLPNVTTCAADLPWQHAHGASIALIDPFLSAQIADQLYQSALAWPHWQQHHIKVYGRRHAEPRLGLWCADAGVHYRYSGRDCRACAWPTQLQTLRHLLQNTLQQRFNGVLGNYYRDGNDAMGWHSDDERCLGAQPLIAAISLGAGRDFLLRRKDDHQRKIKLQLQHGSLLLMAGTTQQYWQHALPRRKKVSAARINLSFRHILAQDPRAT